MIEAGRVVALVGNMFLPALVLVAALVALMVWAISKIVAWSRARRGRPPP